MELFSDVDIKSVVFGAAIAATCFIIGMNGYDFAYLFASVGLLYTGYKAKNLKMGAALGAFASTPLMVLSLDQRFVGVLELETQIIIVVLIFAVGALIGFVGAWAKRDRVKAKEEYEKKKPGKKKNKKKKQEKTQKE